VNFVVHGIVVAIKNVRIEVIKGFTTHPLVEDVYDCAVVLIPFTFRDIGIVLRPGVFTLPEAWNICLVFIRF
jgi:hypothetical protein